MSIELLTGLMFLAILFSFFIGAPVAFALGGVAMLFGGFSWGPQSFKLIATTELNSATSFILLSVPLFVFMGQMLVRSGLGDAMFQSAYVLAGRVRGGLALGVVAVSALIGAMVGIIGAGVMTAGAVALPPMLQRGYDKRLALGVIMAAGSLAMLIPPSVPMIIFASTTSTSLVRLFAGTLAPALLLVALYCGYIILLCRIRPAMGPAIEGAYGAREKLRAVGDGGMGFLLIVAVLGSILFGLATPTEAAAIGAVGATLIAVLYRKFSLKVLRETSFETGMLTSVVVWIVLGAAVFSNFHLLMGAGRLLNRFTAESGLPPFAIILLMQLSMLLMGLIIDEMIIVIVCAPLYTPIAVSLGFDPVWFGTLMILNMSIAVQTPPYGFALFYLKAVAPPGITMRDLYGSVAPFLALKLLVLAVVMFIPEVATYLPRLLFD